MRHPRRVAPRTGDAAPALPAESATTDPIAVEVARLDDLDLVALRQRWQKLTGQKAPAQLSRAVLLGMLAYRLQTDAYGDIDHETARFFASIAKQRASGDQRPVPPVEAGRVGRLKAGSVLVREHGGTLHRVMVLKEGFAWLGTTYDSLSAVAKAITGTNWNGPRFFGLRERAADKQESRRSSYSPLENRP